METIGKELGGGIYNASYRVIGESNAIAAMPSIHMAITFLLVFPAFYAGKRWGIVALIYATLMGYALVYLGEHYVVDVVVGCIVTTYAWFASAVWLRRVAPAISFSTTRRDVPAPGIPLEPKPAAG
jgi:membrane-associated phospholipid phosphatase